MLALIWLSLLGTIHARISSRATATSTPPDVGIVHEDALHRRAIPGIPGTDTSFVQYLTPGPADIYIIHLELGTPPKRYPFQLDLASSDLLIASSLCTGDSCPDVKDSDETPVYIPGQSGSFEAINGNTTTFNLTYADGSGASGFLALEKVGIVGSGGRVTVENQVVGVVNETTMDLQSLGVSGIVGLGFARGSVFVREGLQDDQAVSVSVTATRTSAVSSSLETRTTTTTIDSTSLFFSILPIETITPIPVPTSATLRRRATTPSYFSPLVENLFSHPSINTSSPRLAYPVFSLALANSSAPYGEGNANASITWGGVSSAFVDDSTGSGVGDIDWVPVVPFARAVSTPHSNTTGGETDLDVLEGEEYLYWAVPLANISTNGTALDPEPTYNSSLTGIDTSIALLDAGTNGIYGPQQDVLRLFSRIKDARQVSDGQWAVPCDTEITLTFHISHTQITLQPSEWIYARVQGGSMCLAWPRVAPAAGDGVDWQLGTPVLRKVVAVFAGGISGVQAPLVGLLGLPAPLGNNAPTTGSSTRPTTVQDASQIMEHVTNTIATALPNVLLPDPSYITPPYAFTTPAPSLGALQSAGLGNPLVYEVEDVPVVQVSTSLATMTTTGTGTGTRGSASPRPSEAVGTGNSAASAALAGPRMGLGAILAVMVVGMAMAGL
ncbi:hypothetical protein QFC20_004379 [Naganishia adeliensis]|uniref:Uncharacterized protein n=1 Tax=Naganishia adeliensis TaxID=92952 RepID=A0ACC2W135_9TREE|nr:hypothetical protein QFC20_004379 [Naganishia adeliensis]